MLRIVPFIYPVNNDLQKASTRLINITGMSSLFIDLFNFIYKKNLLFLVFFLHKRNCVFEDYMKIISFVTLYSSIIEIKSI